MAIDYNKPGVVTKTVGHHRQMQVYMKDIAIRFLDLVAEGKTIVEIAELDGMPTRQTLYRWLSLYKDFNTAYKEARRLSAQAFEDKALAIADELAGPNNFTGTLVTSKKEAMVQYRWSASKRDPATYGQTPPNAVVTVPIQINTNLDLNQEKDIDGYSFTATIVPPADVEPDDIKSPDDPPAYDPNEDVDIGETDPYNAPDTVPAFQAKRPPTGKKDKRFGPKKPLGPRQAAKQRAANVAKRNKTEG